MYVEALICCFSKTTFHFGSLYSKNKKVKHLVDGHQNRQQPSTKRLNMQRNRSDGGPFNVETTAW